MRADVNALLHISTKAKPITIARKSIYAPPVLSGR